MRVAAIDIGFLNLVVCVLSTTDDPATPFIIHTWDRWLVGNPDTTATVLVELLLRRLHEDRALFADVDMVVIERQMVTKLSVLAHALQAYFLTLRLTNGHGPGVVLQHGTRKNQCGAWLARHGMAPAETGKAAYAVYKRRAVVDTQQALKLQSEQGWRDKFGREGKKDDMADALLHGLWYLFCRNQKGGVTLKEGRQCSK